MLTAKQKQFCDEYVKDYNATQAAIRAGYSEKTASSQASRLLKNPAVIERIKEKQKELLDTHCMTEDRVLAELIEILNRCMSAVPVMEWDYSEHSLVPTGEYQFDSKGALKAIKLLGQHIGMFTQKVELTNISDESIKEMEQYFDNQKSDIEPDMQ